jgi:hypothetical protein
LPRYHRPMGAVSGGVLLVAVLAVIVVAFSWQIWRRRRDPDPVYVLDDAARFVHSHLEPSTRTRVDRGLVRRVLEWQLEFHQVIAPRSGEPSVLGSGEGIEHVLEQAAKHDVLVEARDVAEIVAAEVEYLVAIGAVGAPAAET